MARHLASGWTVAATNCVIGEIILGGNIIDYRDLCAEANFAPMFIGYPVHLVAVSGSAHFFYLLIAKISVFSAAFPQRIWCGYISPLTAGGVIAWTGFAAT